MPVWRAVLGAGLDMALHAERALTSREVDFLSEFRVFPPPELSGKQTRFDVFETFANVFGGSPFETVCKPERPNVASIG